MNPLWEQTLLQKLNQRRTDGLLRRLLPGLEGIDFYSNDYLGLARDEALAEIVRSAAHAYPNPHGATGSRLISGNHPAILETEAFMRHFFKSQAGLFVGSGYLANVAVCSTLPSRHDTVLYDELIHACVKDGLRMGMAKHYSFQHNDLADFKNKLSRAEGQVFVYTESVYSMDGDTAPLKMISELCKAHNAVLIVDEAHTTALMPEARGYCLTHDIDADVRIYTFGKAGGAHGAFIACSQTVCDYLVNFARPFIYTTAPPAGQCIAAMEHLRYAAEHPELYHHLMDNSHLFDTLAAEKGLTVVSAGSAIKGVLYPGNDRAKEKARELNDAGFLVKAILSPTVPPGSERIRVCIHSYNTTPEIRDLVKAL